MSMYVFIFSTLLYPPTPRERALAGLLTKVRVFKNLI